MALRIWDTASAEYRDVTQADIDELQEIAAAYGRIQTRFTEDRAMLVKTIMAVRSRAGVPNDMAVATEPVTGDL